MHCTLGKDLTVQLVSWIGASSSDDIAWINVFDIRMTSSALEVRLDGVTDVGTNVLQNRISRCVRLHVVAIVVIVAEQVLAGTLRDDDNGVSSTMHDLLDVMQCSIIAARLAIRDVQPGLLCVMCLAL